MEAYTKLNVTIVGDAAVGKTCIVQSLVNNIFVPLYTPTMFNKYHCIYKLSSTQNIDLTIW